MKPGTGDGVSRMAARNGTGPDGSSESERFPALGRAFLWVDRPGNPLRIVWALTVACGLLLLADVFLVEHKVGGMASLPGFFAGAGFVMFSTIIIAARLLRTGIGRREDYYGDRAIDRETYPDDQLGKADHGC